MKVTFAPSFYKSLQKIFMHQTWWYKTYEFFRYNLPYFFRNLWWFRKELWNFRGWDYSYNLKLFSRSLEKTANVLDDGDEKNIYRIKKVAKIRRVIEILNSMDEFVYIEKSEKQLGEIKNFYGFLAGIEDTPEEDEHNRKVYDLAYQMEKNDWDELFEILKGKDIEEYKKFCDSIDDSEKQNRDTWNEWYDGSGINRWSS